MNNIKIFGIPYLKKGSGIHIKKKNRGKFTEFCGGKVTDECILKAKKSKNPRLRKRATFAANARKWEYQEGGIFYRSIPSRNYEKSEGDTEYIKQAVQNSRNWMSDWYAKRKATGKYDDLLLDMDFIQNRIKNTPVTVSSNYIDSAGKFVSPSKESLGAITLYSNPEKMEGPTYNRNLLDNIIHELGHAATMYKTLRGYNYSNFEQANDVAKQNVSPSVHKVNSIIEGNLIPMGGDYEATSAEITARLLSMRQAAKMDPTKTYKYGDMKDWLKKFNLDFGKEKSEALMNEVAYNLINDSYKHKTFLAKKGKKLHKPFGHRAVTDNGWYSTKELKKRPLIAISAKSGTTLEDPTKDTGNSTRKPVNKRPVPGFMPLARNTKKEKKDFKSSPKKDKVVGVKLIGINWDKVT